MLWPEVQLKELPENWERKDLFFKKIHGTIEGWERYERLDLTTEGVARDGSLPYNIIY